MLLQGHAVLRGCCAMALLRTAQDDLVDYLKDDGVIKSPPVEAAMRAVDRAHFCDPSMPRSYKYQVRALIP